MGVLARNPSFILKRVYFVSDYADFRGVHVPTRLIINADTWIAGRSDMVLWFENYRIEAGGNDKQIEDSSGAAN